MNPNANRLDVVSTCSFITDNNVDKRRQNFCGSTAAKGEKDCPVSCGLCPDKDDLFFRSAAGLACSEITADACTESSTESSCPVSCKNPNVPCADEPEFRFGVRDQTGTRIDVPCTYLTLGT